MMRMKFVKSLCCFIMFAAVFGSTQATLLSVEDIQLSIPGTYFYQGDGADNYFSIDNRTPINAQMRVFGAAGFDYGLNAVVNVTPCGLITDTSLNGWASGNFAGGATLTITGDITDKDTGATLYDGGTILVAEMVIGAGGTWVIAESDIPRSVNGGADYTPVNGGLSSGILLSNGDTLKIGDFRADFSFVNVSPDPTEFITDPSLSSFNSTIQITAVPEPATLSLLAVGLVGLLRKRRN